MVENNLTITHPELCKEWDYEKNEKGPENYTHGSHAKVFWILNYYDTTKNKNFVFEWQSSIKTRCNGVDCPYLAANSKVWVGFNDLASNNPELAALWHPTKNGNLKPTEVTTNSHKKIWWYKKYLDPITNKEHEFEWLSTICSMNKKKGKEMCPYLTDRLVWKNYNDLASKNPELAALWHPTKNGNLKPTEITCTTKKNIWWYKRYLDPITNKEYEFEWISTVGNMNSKKGEKCPYLTGRSVWPNFNDLATTHSSIAKQWNYEKNNFTPQEVSIGSEKIAYFTCENGHTFKSRIYSRINNSCPFCSASSAEKLTHSILDKYNMKYEIEKRFVEEVKRNPYDIFLNNENLFIELDGEQHFKSMKFFDICTPFSKRVEIDNKKNKCAFENNIPLLRIPYTYFKEELKMESLVLDFIRTRIIPKEIIDFYSQYEFSNYAELAEKYNETLELKVS